MEKNVEHTESSVCVATAPVLLSRRLKLVTSEFDVREAQTAPAVLAKKVQSHLGAFLHKCTRMGRDVKT